MQEALRIEQKFSRYRDDNIIHAINHSDGSTVAIEDETHRLLQYAGQCYELSDGAFDITSGILRRAWNFNGREITPDEVLISSLLTRVGWDKVQLENSSIMLLPGMELDLGGIGKEYAVDKVANLLHERSGKPLMVNFGGDIRAIGVGSAQRPWTIGIEDPSRENSAVGSLELTDGAVATSGDARRFCLVNGVRMGHILNPLTGWPVVGAPRSVTVTARHCVEAGFLATMAILQGADAEEFLETQEVTYNCIR